MKSLSLAAALGLGLAIGMVTGAGLHTQAADVVVEPGWRYSDGYWNYWDQDDKAWYYTDGRHWYGYGNDGWTPYKFDRSFGRKVYRQGYTVPVPGPNVVIPKHKINVQVK